MKKERTSDPVVRKLYMQLARVTILTIVLAGTPILIVGFTVLPSLSDLAAQLISAGCGLFGVVAAWTVEIVYQQRNP